MAGEQTRNPGEWHKWRGQDSNNRCVSGEKRTFSVWLGTYGGFWHRNRRRIPSNVSVIADCLSTCNSGRLAVENRGPPEAIKAGVLPILAATEAE